MHHSRFFSVLPLLLLVAVLALGVQTVRLSSALRAVASQQSLDMQNIQTLATYLGVHPPSETHADGENPLP